MTTPPPIDSTNQEWFNAMIRHQIFLMRMSGGLRNEILGLLDATEASIRERILKDPLTFPSLAALLNDVSTIRNKAWDKVDPVWIEEMHKLAQAEPLFIAGALQTVVPVILELETPSPQVLRGIVNAKPFQGRTLKAWTKDLRRADVSRMDVIIKEGVTQGRSNQEIVSNIMGGTSPTTIRKSAFELNRQQTAKIVRTATNAIGNSTRSEFFKDNRDIFTEEIYVATLDHRTTPICRKLDGQRFPIGEGWMPPVHVGCRSIRIPEIDGVAMGERPMKTTTEKGLIRDFSKENNLVNVKARRQLPRGFKGRFDEWAKVKIKKGTGRIKGETDYQEFLEGQSKAFQEDVLGITKAKLFREGGLTLDKYVDRAGTELTIGDLARKHKEAFKAAGLDPEDFL